MKRLDIYVNVFKESYLDDCLYLKSSIPCLSEVDNCLIQMLYTTWCEDTWLNSWFKPDLNTAKDFEAWLETEIQEELSN